MTREALLVLADGTTFQGEALGAVPAGGIAGGEVVFNTIMSGYQELLTDPACAGQMVTFTYPHIGNYGVNLDDNESSRPQARGIIVRELARTYSSWRANEALEAFLKRHGVPGITEVDTRRLTRHLREAGAMPGVFGVVDERVQGHVTESALREAALDETGVSSLDLVAEVSTPEPYEIAGSGNAKRRIVAYDFGIRASVLRQLSRLGDVLVVSASTAAEEVLEHKPDGVFLSSGPGDPSSVTPLVDTVRSLLGKAPIFATGLGYQLMAVALGGRVERLPVGHHGANHPVRNLETGVVDITTHNHSFTVAEDSLSSVKVTHRNLNDGVVEGMRCVDLPAFGLQHQPHRASAGTQPASPFDEFGKLMKEFHR